MMIYTDLLYAVGDRIARITLNRPKKLNAFRGRTLVELTHALRAAAKDTEVRVVVLTGAGDRAFCAGGDVAEMRALTRATGRVYVGRLLELARAFLDCGKPIVARVDGWCLGGGNEIQLFCDFAVASDRSRFGQVGAKIGSAPLWGGTLLLPRAVGWRKAKEIMLLARTYSAAEALAMGLIDQVAPAAELDRAVDRICSELLAKSPQSLRVIKKSLHRGLLTELKKDLAELARLYGTAELKEGMRAFFFISAQKKGMPLRAEMRSFP